MNPAQLLAHFDHISDAPDAIPRLRRFILDLAVRGKLVEQDLRDEPSSELLKRIQAKKVRLVSAGEMKKEKPLSVIEEDEIPFAIPVNWQWVRLNDITSYIQRGRSPKYATGEGLPVISQKCIQWGGLDLESAKRITRESIEDYETIRFLRSGDLLWNSTGTGTIGRIIKVKEPPPKLVCDSHVTVVRCLEVDAEYVRSWLCSDHVYAVIEDRAAGSTNQVELTSQLAVNQVVPLPPLTEQHRIVANVDELMALCDRLDTAQAERESRRDRLAAASLQRLNQPVEDASAFREHVQFYFNRVPRLTTRPKHIEQLRKTILSLAVHGQLVPQDPNDEPASVLLKRVETEKARLAMDGKIRKPEPPLQIDDEGLPFNVPPGWSWARLVTISLRIHYGYTASANQFLKDVRLLRITDIQNNSVDWSSVPGCEISDRDVDQYKLEQGDILIARTGGTIGKTFLVRHIPVTAVFASYLIRVQGSSELYDQYLKLFLESPTYWKQLQEGARGGGQPNVNGQTLGRMVVTIPPLAEQHRIVAKVEELMALCDRLEAQLTTTQTESRRLLEAILHDALAGQSELEQGVRR